MSVLSSEAPDIGATVTSPLIAAAECRLPANVNDAVFLDGEDAGLFALGDGTVRRVDICDEDGPAARAEEAPVLVRHDGAVTRLALLPGGFVSAGQDGRVVLHAPPAGPKPLADFKGRWVDALAVHGATGRIAAASGTALRVAASDGTKLFFKADGFPSTVSGLAFAPEGRRLAAAHLDGVTIVSVDEGTEDLKLAWKGSQIGVSWAPDGRYLVTATQERELHVWDLVTLQDFRIGGYPHKVHGLRWSKDGRYLFCTGADVVTAWVFDGSAPGGKPPIEMGYVYDGLVTAVAVHPERPLVAGGYSTGAVLVGGVARGEALIARAGGGARVTALAWSRDGRRLLAGTEAGEVVLMDLPADMEL